MLRQVTTKFEPWRTKILRRGEHVEVFEPVAGSLIVARGVDSPDKCRDSSAVVNVGHDRLSHASVAYLDRVACIGRVVFHCGLAMASSTLCC